MVKPPKSMVAELSAWNNGNGIDLQSWVGCSGNFKLAVGYSTIFWSQFVVFEDYIFRENFTIESVRGFEEQTNGNKQTVESIINHLHLDGIQYSNCEDISEDKIVFLGRVLKEIWEAKLRWQFPDRPCEVELYEPEDRTKLIDFQLTFWQKKHLK